MSADAPAPPALLVIDMINRLDFDGAERMAPGALAAARRIGALRVRFHARAWPVLYANDTVAHWRADFRELVAMPARPEGARAKLGRRRALLAGPALASCPLATGAAANAREYELAVVRAAVAGQPAYRQAALRPLAGPGTARVVASRSAIAWAGRPGGG